MQLIRKNEWGGGQVLREEAVEKRHIYTQTRRSKKGEMRLFTGHQS